MIFEKIVSEGLAHNSYFIGAGGSAAVIDPRRDCEVYMQLAEQYGVDITHIFETHRNEDYLIGSVPLAEKVKAEIYHSDRTEFAYGQSVREGDTFRIGSLELEILETPGHTPESISIIVRDHEVSGEPYLVFTGDALFAGEVGRTDLVKGRQEEMAKLLAESIFDKLLKLDDGVLVFPAHGAGSACGGHIADHPHTTIGYEKRTNPRLRKGREAFIREKSREILYFPPYFSKVEALNLIGPAGCGRPYLEPLSIQDVHECRRKGAQVLDIRSPTAFAGGHLPGSIHIWREGLTSYMGYLLNYEDPIVLVHDYQDLESFAADFIRMGYDNVAGYLGPKYSAWFTAAQEIETTRTWSVQDLHERLSNPTLFILDVRDIRNRRSIGHIPGSRHIFVGHLADHLGEVPRDRTVVVYCDSGFKGSLGASILQKHGYEHVVNLLGGATAWVNAGYPVEKE